ncbi:MAG: hypothetical protein LBP63_08990, partial [Prevotellaceae bacterium]|nr:hypothetical protein [Prevotellaceae bacterium]
MTEIRQIENDGKNIMVNNAVQPAVFVATAAGNAVRIISTVRFITNISTQGINYESLEINGEVPASANDAVQKLNSFIGAFKSGGGGVSPEFQYSTDEQWTGKYWIDGKKIYTRVSTGTVSAAADEVVNILLQSGVSALISVSGTWN